MAAAEVLGQEFLIGDGTVVLEDEIVEADTIVQLQLVSDIPFVLCIEANLVEGNLRDRLLIAVVTRCQYYGSRSSTIHEVLHRGIAVVARTLAHIGIDGALVLKVESGRELVGTHIVGEVVVDGQNLVLHAVVIGEELIA